MTQKDAAMFPIIASAALFGLYVFFQVGTKCLTQQMKKKMVQLMNFSIEYLLPACVKRLHQFATDWLLLFLGYSCPDPPVEPSCHSIHPCFYSQHSFPLAIS